jgi:hypothetical protein
MTILTFLGTWFLISLIVGPIVGTIIKKTNPLDEDTTND